MRLLLRIYNGCVALAFAGLFSAIVYQLAHANGAADFCIKLFGWAGILFLAAKIHGLHSRDRRAQAADDKARAIKAAKLARRT